MRGPTASSAIERGLGCQCWDVGDSRKGSNSLVDRRGGGCGEEMLRCWILVVVEGKGAGFQDSLFLYCGGPHTHTPTHVLMPMMRGPAALQTGSQTECEGLSRLWRDRGTA